MSDRNHFQGGLGIAGLGLPQKRLFVYPWRLRFPTARWPCVLTSAKAFSHDLVSVVFLKT